jgi:hypothetical protein
MGTALQGVPQSGAPPLAHPKPLHTRSPCTPEALAACRAAPRFRHRRDTCGVYPRRASHVCSRRRCRSSSPASKPSTFCSIRCGSTLPQPYPPTLTLTLTLTPVDLPTATSPPLPVSGGRGQAARAAAAGAQGGHVALRWRGAEGAQALRRTPPPQLAAACGRPLRTPPRARLLATSLDALPSLTPQHAQPACAAAAFAHRRAAGPSLHAPCLSQGRHLSFYLPLYPREDRRAASR